MEERPFRAALECIQNRPSGPVFRFEKEQAALRISIGARGIVAPLLRTNAKRWGTRLRKMFPHSFTNPRMSELRAILGGSESLCGAGIGANLQTTGSPG